MPTDFRAIFDAERNAPRQEKAKRFLNKYVAATEGWDDLRDSLRHAAGHNAVFVRYGLDGLEDVLGGRPSATELLELSAVGGHPVTDAVEARSWLESVARLVRDTLGIGPYGPQVADDTVSTMIRPDGEWVRVRCVGLFGDDAVQLAVFVHEGTQDVAFVGRYVPGPETVTPATSEETERAIREWRDEPV